MSWIVDPVSQVELWVPEYATPQRAIAREARRRAGELVRLDVYPEWGASTPFWTNDDDDGLRLVELSLSTTVREEVGRWCRWWRRDFDVFTGWIDVETRDAWIREGDRLMTGLERELWDVAEVHPKHRTFTGVRHL